MNQALQALRKVNFDWTAHIDEIWVDQRNEATELQAAIRVELDERLEDLRESKSMASPLGLPLLGPAGSGKTHLLGVLRRQALDRGMHFVLVDMTDVADFWDTVSLGFLRSLQQELGDGRRQIDHWLEGMLRDYGAEVRKPKDVPGQRPPGLINTTNQLINAVRAKHRKEVQEHVDVLRALVLFSCDHADVNDLGYKWLQGLGIDEDEQQHYAFRQTQQKPSRIVRGLSWLLSLQAPTILALDQFDAIVAEHELATGLGNQDEEDSEQGRRSQAIIQGIAGGLLELRDVTRRTLSVVSSLEATWNILDRQAPVSMADRYESKLLLRPGAEPDVMKKVVLGRLSEAYAAKDFTPPYPSYPYAEGFFDTYRDNTPREVLKACDVHRKACRRALLVSEAGGGKSSPPTSSPPEERIWTEIEHIVQRTAGETEVETLLQDDSEDAQDLVIEALCEALVLENPVPESVIPQVEKDFMGTGNYDPLHARVKLILTDQHERERHHSFRFLEKSNPRAFQARLKAALTASGIDQNLSFRGLTVIRCTELPGGKKTEELAKELAVRGGRLIAPTKEELSLLIAISKLLGTKDEPDHFEEWLEKTRPVSTMSHFAPIVDKLFGRLEKTPESQALDSTAPPASTVVPGARARARQLKEAAERAQSERSTTNQEPQPQGTMRLAGAASALPIGHRLIAREKAEEISIPLESLPYHTCVFAGSGSGKTVFLKRVVEEAALLGIPSIVIDGANDLSRLGARWPGQPEALSNEDMKRSELYHQNAEVVVWTPGAPTGNPMRLNPLPDFAALAGDSTPELEEERRVAIEMATSSLSDLLVQGRGLAAGKSIAIIRSTLKHFSKRGGSIRDLVRYLREPPEDVTEHYEKGPKLAQELSELLHAVIVNDPLIGGAGTPLDPAVLFQAKDKSKTRVSVLNLVGLPDDEAKRRFMDQLASTLFTWIKKHPAPPGGLLGLLIIDEAKDFVPSTKNVPGKENIVRLAAQARKYGLGLVFATQEPKSIAHTVVANCSTLLGGKMNSSAAINGLQDLLNAKGGRVKDVASLDRGQFYFASGAQKPCKIATSLCLSFHPTSPPAPDAILEIARESAQLSEPAQ